MNSLQETVDEFEHMLVPENYGGSISILLVEDSDADAHVVMEGLRQSRISNVVEHVYNADAAWQRLQSKKRVPDWIFIDLNLVHSEITGDELINKISQDTKFKETRVIILSGMPLSKEQEDKFFESKVNFFFLKPLKVVDIIDMVITSPANVWMDFYKKHEVA